MSQFAYNRCSLRLLLPLLISLVASRVHDDRGAAIYVLTWPYYGRLSWLHIGVVITLLLVVYSVVVPVEVTAAGLTGKEHTPI